MLYEYHNAKEIIFPGYCFIKLDVASLRPEIFMNLLKISGYSFENI